MLRLIKYLRPYILLIVVAIALLFVQANADLALPDYLSKIVNVGLQQSGVESAVPVAIRKSQMDKLLVFMSPEEGGLVLDAYRLVEPASPEADQYVDDYPALADVPVYVLQEVDQATRDRLSPIMARALVVVSGIEQIMADPSAASPMAESFGFDPSRIPEGVDVFALLERMPAAQLTQMSQAITERFAALGDSMVNQMAVAAVKVEYEALGMDTAKVQRDYILRTGGLILLFSLLGGACTIAVAFWRRGRPPVRRGTSARIRSPR